jgi:flagellar biosynthetic protein FlhB
MPGSAAEDRTLAPSQQRLQQARALGQVAQSPELTAAVGLLAATLLLGWYGDDLAAILIALLRAPLTEPPTLAAEPAEVVARLRHLALAVAWPLGAIVAGAAAAAVAAHQVQVRGLWAPHLLAPDPARLWAVGRGAGVATKGARGAWGLIKVVLVVAVAAVALRADAPRRQRLGSLEPRGLAAASAVALRQFTLSLATATLALGLLDFFLQHRRYMALLHMTPEEQREDLRSMEGDPALRAQRRRIARTLRNDPRDTLSGAGLLLKGAAGLTVIIAGGPPPQRFTIRSIARGAAGLRLRDAATRARLPDAAAPALALRLASRSPALPLSAEDAAALAALWPAPHATAATTSGRVTS